MNWRQAIWAASGAMLAASFVFVAIPAPIEPEAFEPEPGITLAGVFAPNTALQEAELIADGRLDIPEDVAFDSSGRLYTGTHDGWINRLTLTGGRAAVERFADVGGHPLGLIFGRDDTLYVANHGVGLQSVTPGGSVRLLTENFGDQRIRFVDDLDISSDGTIYFSDASARFNNSTIEGGPPYLPLDMLEARPHGALYAYDLATGQTRQLLDELYFANGVALTADESTVLVVETPRYQVRRLWLTGAAAGTTDIVIDRVPGFADGITSDGNGRVFVSIQSPRSTFLDDIVHPRPWLKMLISKLPTQLWVRPRRYGLVLVYDERSGEPLGALHDPQGGVVFSVANTVPHGDRLYLGSLSNNAIASVQNPFKR